MTNNTLQNTIIPLVLDLDENIISDTLDVAGFGNDSKVNTRTITFHNPVTGSTDRVIFESEDYENNFSIFYVIGYSVHRINEELIMEDLQDLYDFILMDDKEPSVK